MAIDLGEQLTLANAGEVLLYAYAGVLREGDTLRAASRTLHILGGAMITGDQPFDSAIDWGKLSDIPDPNFTDLKTFVEAAADGKTGPSALLSKQEGRHLVLGNIERAINARSFSLISTLTNYTDPEGRLLFASTALVEVKDISGRGRLKKLTDRGTYDRGKTRESIIGRLGGIFLNETDNGGNLRVFRGKNRPYSGKQFTAESLIDRSRNYLPNIELSFI